MKAILIGVLVVGCGMLQTTSVFAHDTDTIKKEMITKGHDCIELYAYTAPYVPTGLLDAVGINVPTLVKLPAVDCMKPVTTSAHVDTCQLFPLPRSGLRCI